ncbi:MAG TPA: hypothetical protein VHB79_22185 [Polyangiaceae bacterium]|nr:hypothetical protein [Polyangiaceae bacterium]
MAVVPFKSRWVSVAAWLALSCATYEQMPTAGGNQEPIGDAAAGTRHTPATGGTSGSGVSGATTRGGSLSSGGNDAAGKPSMTAGGMAPGEGGEPPTAGGAAGSASGAAGASTGAGGADGRHFLAWTFDSGASDWMIRDQSPELAAKLSETAGAVELLDVPFSTVKQFVDLAYTFSPAANLSGRTLHVALERTAGGFVGVQVYAYGGAWGSPSFDSLGSSGPVMLSVPLDELAAKGVNPAAVTRIGLKIGTGSNANGTFGTSSIRVTEVTID